MLLKHYFLNNRIIKNLFCLSAASSLFVDVKNKSKFFAYTALNRHFNIRRMSQKSSFNDHLSSSVGSSSAKDRHNGHKFTNKLINEKSPYLLQHSHNPVNWYPWGQEAFLLAKNLNRLIFLSIGYSTCHWCHVMAEECFENVKIAELMNDNFVCIKVDREERPDIDKQYMTFVSLVTGSGGWPLNVFLTPDLKPIFGGTYFPPSDSGSPFHQGISFPSLLNLLASRWREMPESITSKANSIHDILSKATEIKGATSDLLSSSTNPYLWAQTLYEHLRSSFDNEHGGFGDAPKFPTPVNLEFLLLYHYLNRFKNEDWNMHLKNLGIDEKKIEEQSISFNDCIGISEDMNKGKILQESSDPSKQSLSMVEFTLKMMSNGGMYDQLDGGFHRYSVDAFFFLPHFEKMIYDQAQLLSVYANAYKLTKNEDYKNVVQEIADYVTNTLIDPSTGAFFSAEDADSLPYKESSAKKEGSFYVWTKGELVNIFADRLDLLCLVCQYYGIKDEGNVDPKYDPHGHLKNQNILSINYSWEEFAEWYLSKNKNEKKEKKDIISQLRRDILLAKKKLREVRTGRPRPHLDDKIITSWNGLMISALAKASFIDPSYLDRSIKAADFFVNQMIFEEAGFMYLYRSYRHGPSDIKGFDTDYANLIQAFLDLYTVTGLEKWISLANRLQNTLDRRFFDQNLSAYLLSDPEQTNQNPSAIKILDDQDGAEPCSQSISLSNIIRLYKILNKTTLMKDRIIPLIERYKNVLSQMPNALPAMTTSCFRLDFSASRIILIGERDSANFSQFNAILRSSFLPLTDISIIDMSDFTSQEDSIVTQSNPFLKSIIEKFSKDKQTSVYICSHGSCSLPITDAHRLSMIFTRSS